MYVVKIASKTSERLVWRSVHYYFSSSSSATSSSEMDTLNSVFAIGETSWRSVAVAAT